jgi:hypothetical protein
LSNPYGDGHAVERIISAIVENLNSNGLFKKKFYNISSIDAGFQS